MNSSLRKEDETDDDGYRFVRFYDGEKLMEKQSYRPDGSLMDKVVYEWDEKLSCRLPARWKVFSQEGRLESSCEHIGFNEAGSPQEGIMYDSEGRETHRTKLKR
jgi:hypothetical protein